MRMKNIRFHFPDGKEWKSHEGAFLKYASFLRYGVAGGICTLVDFIAYSILCRSMPAAGSKTVSMGCSILLAFFLHKCWSFSSGNNVRTEIWKYLVVQAFNLFVNVSMNSVLLTISGHRFFAYAAATGTAMVLNYLLLRSFVFRKED